MALVKADLTNDISGSFSVDFTRESSRRYQMFFNTNDDENYVRLNCGLTIGTRHPTDTQQVLNKISYECQGTVGNNELLRMWFVTANYGPWNPAEKGDPADAGNPTQQPARWRVEWEVRPEPVWEDVDGNPILNTAGDAFDPPIERDNLIAILTVSRNEAEPDFASLITAANKVNKDPWNGFDAKTVKVAPITIPEIEYSQETEQYYYPMIYTFQINRDTWVRKPLNTGYRQVVSGKVVPILDDGGQTLQSPGLLDQSGVYLKPPVTKDNIIIGSFDVLESIDFGTFNMDELFTPPSVLS